MLTTKNLTTLIEQRELIQDDLLCILDGLGNKILDDICNIIVERFQILIDKLEEKN